MLKGEAAGEEEYFSAMNLPSDTLSFYQAKKDTIETSAMHCITIVYKSDSSISVSFDANK